MKKFTQTLKYWLQLLLLPIYWFSFITPRDNNIWLFGSTFGRRFADNPRYFYLYINQHEKNIRPIWISRNKEIITFLNKNNYEAYYYNSLKGIYYCLIGKVYIFDNYSKDINFWLSGGAVKINLWHGVGNKRINYDNEHDKVRHPKNLWEKFKYFPRQLSDEKPSHYILATSKIMSEIFARAFRVDMSHIIEAGYPRNDILFDNCDTTMLYTDTEKKLIDIIDKCKAKGNKILGYIPTFRASENNFIKIMDLNKFNDFIKENRMFLICKLHPKSSCREEFEKMNYSNIVNVSADVDVNSFLGKIDILISDYSSVYSDFMLLDRPVVAFQYDYDEYINNTRDTYFDFDLYMPEIKAKNMTELMEALTQVLKEDTQREKRLISKKIMFKAYEESAGKELNASIIKILKKCDKA